MSARQLDPIAATVRAHIDQMHRDAAAHQLAKSARVGRTTHGWVVGITAARRDTVVAALNRPSPAPAANRSSAVCCT
jgi:hypothetical protein